MSSSLQSEEKSEVAYEECRYQTSTESVAKATLCLKLLPPTPEVVSQHVFRLYKQVQRVFIYVFGFSQNIKLWFLS